MRVGKVGDDRNRKTKTERQVMKKQYSSVVSWLAIYLFAGFMAFGHAANAQESPGITTWGAARGGVPAGVPAHGVMIVLNGQDVGSSLLKACDTNQDGVGTVTEVKAALLNWFQQADADKNGALSEIELATALKLLFPPPEPPLGAPPLPEDHALPNLLAKKLMTAVDANTDGWITFQQAIAFVDQNFSKWDADKNGWLDSSEFAAAFAQLMPAPSFNRSFESGQGPGWFTTIPE
jgi:Ca2+-binding EF-hand superfamily protein